MKNIINMDIYYKISIKERFYKALPILFYYDHKIEKLPYIYCFWRAYYNEYRNILDFEETILNGDKDNSMNSPWSPYGFIIIDDDDNNDDNNNNNSKDDNDNNDNEEIKYFKQACQKYNDKYNLFLDTNKSITYFENGIELKKYLNENKSLIKSFICNYNYDLLISSIYRNISLNKFKILMKLYNNLNYSVFYFDSKKKKIVIIITMIME